MLFKKEKFQQAVDLRRVGASYSQISTKLRVSKSTISGWFAGSEWSQVIRRQLVQKRQLDWQSQVQRMNAARLKLLHDREERYRQEARASFSELAQNPLFLVGLALYWGEGTKRAKGKVAVINSDPEILKVITKFYREVLLIESAKIRAEVFVYHDQNLEEVRQFWSRALNVPPAQFIKTQILPSRATLTKRKVTYGMCSVYFSSTEFGIKIHEWLKILAIETCGNSSVG